MTESRIKLVAGFVRALAVFSLFICCHAVSPAQSAQSSSPILPSNKDRLSEDPVTSIAEDMRAKRAIKQAEKEYQQNVERARDLSVLSEAVNTSYKKNTYLGSEDLKKLEKAVKLAKAIRNAAGGSDSDNEIAEPPKDLACALSRLAEVAVSLKNNVEKTPKHVVSAAVIDEANVLLELTRIVRTLIPTR